MAITLPLPLRVAAGIVATGIRVVRTLPEEIPAIPVAVVGHAMRLSMRVQQEITTLATRGDELIGGLVGGRPQEHPSWATFDEDTPSAQPRPARVRPAERPQPTAETAATPDESATVLPDGDTTVPPEAETPEARVEPVTEVAVTGEPTAADASDGGPTVESPTFEPTSAADESSARDEQSSVEESPAKGAEPATDSPSAEVADGPTALPGYDRMTLAQVRGHLRELSPADVSTLLAYEQAAANRPPFLTLLSNRLVTLDAQNS